MAALGLSLQTVGMTMQTAYSGNTDGKFRAGENDVNIRYNALIEKHHRRKQPNLHNNMGATKHLNLLLLLGSGPSQLERRDKTASVNARSNVESQQGQL
jgi:HAE1 family hydrophobic/amphiphilic exporter-1